MSALFDALQERYQALVARKEQGETGEEFLEDVRTFVTDAQRAGATVADVGERSQLRAWMRFLANILYDATGIYPDTSLQPLARGQLVDSRLEREEKRMLMPPLGWALVGAAVLVIVAGASLASDLLSPASTSVLPTPTLVPPTSVGRVEVGVGRSDTGGLALQAGVFCTGTTEVIAQFAVPEPLAADVHWGWRLTRAGDIVAREPSLLWQTESTSRTVQVALRDGSPLAAGQYELAFLVDGQPVANRIFEVLAERPRVSSVRVSDVPEGAGRTRFQFGMPAIYVTYDYENFCPGLPVSHTLYHEGEGELIGKNIERWSGALQGQMQVSFQDPRGLPFSPGGYEVVVAAKGAKQERVQFTILEHAFGGIIIAQGVQPDGMPILTAVDNRFDWNTKVIYAIFDYLGMRDDLRWAAVWMRNGQEIWREEHFWDAEADGTEGTYWVTYHDETGRVLPGGSYSVTLSIENVVRGTADFNILYYVPSE